MKWVTAVHFLVGPLLLPNLLQTWAWMGRVHTNGMNWISGSSVLRSGPGSPVWKHPVKSSLDQFCVDSKWGKRKTSSDWRFQSLTSWMSMQVIRQSDAGSHITPRLTVSLGSLCWCRFTVEKLTASEKRELKVMSGESDWHHSSVSPHLHTYTYEKIIGWRVNYFSKGAYSVSSSSPPRLLNWLFEGGQGQIATSSSLIVIKYTPCRKTEGCREQLAAETPLVWTCLCASCCKFSETFVLMQIARAQSSQMFTLLLLL